MSYNYSHIVYISYRILFYFIYLLILGLKIVTDYVEKWADLWLSSHFFKTTQTEKVLL